ncbi:hypothetical protein [Marinobacter alkaliphilus]|uniref:ATP-grasp domain-containing protein n=1 Tax=Marinobacter alkaliphilus TaxID=254719 RepID=A0ABZ3E427_9GAMM
MLQRPDWDMQPPVTRYYGGSDVTRQPGFCVNIRPPSNASEPVSRAFVTLLERAFPEPGFGRLPKPSGHPVGPETWFEWLGYWHHRIVRFAGLPVFEAPKALPSPDMPNYYLVYFPSYEGTENASLSLLKWLLTVSMAPQTDTLVREAMSSLETVMKPLADCAPTSANISRFLFAAFEARLPVVSLGHHMFQICIGASGVWLDSSFTSSTPVMSANLVRNKAATSDFLAKAGIPVPRQALIMEEVQLKPVAEALGFPLVCKPADLDGGKGVHLYLEDLPSLAEAFRQCRELTDQVLVQPQVQGRDYRLTVHRGECVWAIERVPASVIGNGKDTVSRLIERENARPERSGTGLSPLKPLPGAESAKDLLNAQNLKPTSVPATGQVVVLSHLPNVAAGGQPVPVYADIHPDNAELAAKVARLCRLDLAGIDLIMPDISHSWRDIGAWVIEVNAQPDIGQTTAAHLYGKLLGRMLPEKPVEIRYVEGRERDAWGRGDRVSHKGRFWDGLSWQPLPDKTAERIAWARQCLLDDQCQGVWLDEVSWKWFRQAATDLRIQWRPQED